MVLSVVSGAGLVLDRVIVVADPRETGGLVSLPSESEELVSESTVSLLGVCSKCLEPDADNSEGFEGWNATDPMASKSL